LTLGRDAAYLSPSAATCVALHHDSPMQILFADYDFPDIELEREIFSGAGLDLKLAKCTQEAQVIEAACGCAGILLQYAPITAGVVAALPELGVVSRIGAGFDTVDVEACRAHGVWVANSPDYGVGEVATHALALALASLRNVVRYHDDIRGDRWHYLSSGTLRRPAELTLGIVGLGRIGKRMAHVARNAFKRVVAFDPLLIDGDFPAYVERAHSLEALAGQAQGALGEIARLRCLACAKVRFREKRHPARLVGPPAPGGLLDGVAKERDPLGDSSDHHERVAQDCPPPYQPEAQASVAERLVRGLESRDGVVERTPTHEGLADIQARHQ